MMTQMTKLPHYWLGGHVSAAGGFEKAVDRAVAMGANCMQLFSGSPRVWRRTELESLKLDKFYSKIKENNFGPIITHSLYLVNLASDKPESRAKSVAALKYDMAFDALVNGWGIVVHLGSHQGRGWSAVRELVVQELVTIIESSPLASRLLVENSAGQKGKLCSDLEELRWVLDAVRRQLSPERQGQIGWCVDTCHAHAAGYSLSAKPANGPDVAMLNVGGGRSLAGEIDRLQLWSDLKCIHVNDSRDAFGSGRDRHANLGRGQIAVVEFKEFLQLPQILKHDIPLIMEVPGLDDQGPDKPNLDTLKQWLGWKGDADAAI